MTLAEQNDLIVTLPTRATWLKRDNPRVVVRDCPFTVPPLELKMAWSPLLSTTLPIAGSDSSLPKSPGI